MRDIVIIPCFNRPEFLWLCAESLAACMPTDTPKEFWICENDNPSKPKSLATQEENVRAIEHAKQILSDVRYIKNAPSSLMWGNIWESLEAAYNTDARYVYFIEEDHVFSADFFRWNELAQEAFSPFISFGDNVFVPASNDPLAVVVSYSDFEPRACCIKRDNLAELFRKRYRAHPEELIAEHIIKHKKLVVYPQMTRAVDCGWYGSNRAVQKMAGSLEHRIATIRKALVDPTVSGGFINAQNLASLIAWSGPLAIGVDRRDRWARSYQDVLENTLRHGVLIGVMSCQRDRSRGCHDKIRNTWGSKVPNNVKFFLGPIHR